VCVCVVRVCVCMRVQRGREGEKEWLELFEQAYHGLLQRFGTFTANALSLLCTIALDLKVQQRSYPFGQGYL